MSEAPETIGVIGLGLADPGVPMWSTSPSRRARAGASPPVAIEQRGVRTMSGLASATRGAQEEA
jgi:hypothetical protein